MIKFKKLLAILFLGPIIPILGIPDGGGEEDTNTDDKNNEKLDNDNKNKETDKKNDSETKYFSQAEFDKAFEKRLIRERKNFEKEFNEKLEREKMTETQRAQAEKVDAEKRAEEAILKANSRLVKSEINLFSSKMGIIDSEVAYALLSKDDIEVDEFGKVTGVEAALKELVSKKPYLIKKSAGSDDNSGNQIGDDQSGSSGTTKKFDMNAAIRKAAGR